MDFDNRTMATISTGYDLYQVVTGSTYIDLESVFPGQLLVDRS